MHSLFLLRLWSVTWVPSSTSLRAMLVKTAPSPACPSWPSWTVTCPRPPSPESSTRSTSRNSPLSSLQTQPCRNRWVTNHRISVLPFWAQSNNTSNPIACHCFGEREKVRIHRHLTTFNYRLHSWNFFDNYCSLRERHLSIFITCCHLLTFYVTYHAICMQLL